jgi:hypothetical protein
MLTSPTLNDRVIPALGAVQIFGFVALAVFVGTSKDTVSTESDREFKETGKQWVSWLFGFLALLSFIRVILALLSIAYSEGHRHSWFSPEAGAVMGCFFLWLAVKARTGGTSAGCPALDPPQK